MNEAVKQNEVEENPVPRKVGVREEVRVMEEYLKINDSYYDPEEEIECSEWLFVKEGQDKENLIIPLDSSGIFN